MRHISCILTLLFCCVSRPNEVSASPELRLVQLREDVVLPCSLEFNFETNWFRVCSEGIVLLSSTTEKKLGTRFEHQVHADNRYHVVTRGDNRTAFISLQINGVKESDLGLYFCTERKDGKLILGKGFLLAFKDSGPSLSCWTLLSFVTPASAVLTALCVWCLDHRRAVGRFICGNCATENGEKAGNLHYASLHLRGKTRPDQKRQAPPIPGDVIYTVVSHQAPANQSF